MADSTTQLRIENQRLKREIRHFQRALQEVTNQSRPSSRYPLSATRKEALRTAIQAKVQIGLFSPPKIPRSLTTRRGREGKRRDIGKELTSDLSRIESSLEAIQVQNPTLKPALKEEFSALRESLEVLITTQNRTMKDSFESYYNSERENIEEQGKPELSFEDYEKAHNKGERRLNRSLAAQIKQLRCENTRLKDMLNRTEKQGERGTKVGENTWKRSERSPLGYTRGRGHCEGCDFLLSRGLSTTRCRRHADV
jgi:hypothetical protein